MKKNAKTKLLSLLFANIILATLLTMPIWVWIFVSESIVADISRKAGNNAVLSQLAQAEITYDVLFLGSSQTWNGIDHESLVKEFESVEGRKLKSLTIANNWDGLDAQYYKLKYFLKRSKVRLVILESPNLDRAAGQFPHPDSKYYFKFSNFLQGEENIPKETAISLYAEQVLAGPRMLFSAVYQESPKRGNFKTIYRDKGSLLESKGYNGAKFSPLDPPKLDNINFGTTEIKPETIGIKYYGHEISVIEDCYLNLIKKIANENNVKVILFRYPQIDSRYNVLIDRTATLPTYFRSFGAPHQQLFGSSDENILKNFYKDSAHLNSNGAKALGSYLARLLSYLQSDSFVCLGKC